MCNITLLFCDNITINALFYASHHTACRSTLYVLLVYGSKKFKDIVLLHKHH